MTRLRVAAYKTKQIDFKRFNVDSRWTTNKEATVRAKFLRKAGRLARVLTEGKTYGGNPIYVVYVRVK